jgi:hypothetical protein
MLSSTSPSLPPRPFFRLERVVGEVMVSALVSSVLKSLEWASVSSLSDSSSLIINGLSVHY